MRVLNNVLHNTLAQVSARARFTSSTSMSCAWVSVLWLSVPHLVPFRVFLLSFLLLPEPLSWTSSSMSSSSGAICYWHSANWGVWPLGRKHASHRLWAQHPWRLPLLRDYWNLLPGAIQRHGALVLVWRGTRRRDQRKRALFTTVDSGRTSGPKTRWSLFWRKFVASSVFFCVSCKNGETHAWT